MVEQRLIDANALTVDLTYDFTGRPMNGHRKTTFADIRGMILCQPTIDPETLPIVRQLREELAKVTAERDAAVKELDGVSSLVDDLVDFVDREIHPVVDYNLYLDLRENVDAVSMFQHEDEWRGLQKEE